MRFKSLLAFFATLLLIPLGLGPAAAEPEPDNWIWQASGPVLNGQIRGSIASGNDDDWFTFYAASQSQLTITLQPNKCQGFFTDGYSVLLINEMGGVISSTRFLSSSTKTLTYTTPVGTSQYFIQVDSRGLFCPSSAGYAVDITPVAALVAGSPMPTSSVPTGEPNETSQQAMGGAPLSGGVIYTGTTDTSNDADFFPFWASGPFFIRATSGDGCDGDFTLYDSTGKAIRGTDYYSNGFTDISYSPPAWTSFTVQFDSDCTGGAYRFVIWPPESIPLGPPPVAAPPPTPAGVPWIKSRKGRKTVVVYWGPAAGATSYSFLWMPAGQNQFRTLNTSGTWASFKRKRFPRSGIFVKAVPKNAAGEGPGSQMLRIWRKGSYKVVG